MNLLNQIREWNAIPPGVIKDDAAFTSYVIDKQTFLPQGARALLFRIQLGATDVALDTLKVMQSDTEGTATALGGSPTEVHDFTVKPGAGDDNGLWYVWVPLSVWTMRFCQLQVTAGDGTNGTYLAATALTDLSGDGAATAASLGVDNLEIASG